MRPAPPPLKDCPFCGGTATVQTTVGSYGYYPPTLWIECENSVQHEWKKGQFQCFARTKPEQTEDWQQGRGTFSIYEEVVTRQAAAWNFRVEERGS